MASPIREYLSTEPSIECSHSKNASTTGSLWGLTPIVIYSIDSISSGLQESDISIRILSEIKIRTGEASSERSFLAASCSDGSLTKTISCSDSDAGSSFASLRTQYPIVDKGIPFSAHHCLHVFPLAWHCWIRSDQSFAFSSLFIVYKIPPEF